MFHLNSALAQRIVDRTMAIIDSNINVMDASGVIIGSGDPARIHELHEGAQIALANGRTVEIDEETAKQLKGVCPGINLTLHFEDQVIGVLGITGDPDQVRSYGELVKMAAEMIVEQANLTQQLQWDKRHRDELTLQLVRQQWQSEQAVHTWAERLGVDLKKPRVAIVIAIPRSEEGGAVPEVLQKVISRLYALERNALVAQLEVDRVVYLRTLQGRPEGEVPAVDLNRWQQLSSAIESQVGCELKMAVGHYLPGLEGLRMSCQSAIETLAYGDKRVPQKRHFAYDQMRLPVLLASLRQGWQADELLLPYRTLAEQDKNGLLRRTLVVYFEQGMESSAAIQILHIHRNTLRYRLDRIAEITAMDLSRMEHLLQLYIGHLLLPFREDNC